MAKVDRWLRMMVENEVSDLHLTSGVPPYWRQHGTILAIENEEKLTPDLMMEIIEEIAPSMKLDEFKECNDSDFAYEIKGLARFRVNVFMDLQGPGAVLRTIPEEIWTVEKLGLPQSIIDLCYLSKGLVLVTGPTGSGKSTTLAAMVNYINTHRSEHIITIEDPIEFVHKNKNCLINQREITAHTESFKRALRAALREDPDIVLVGEMRDLETVEIAMETAETGHLVFGTLHTSTAASTVERIIQQYPAGKQAQIRQMLAGSLKGVVAQTLCKTKDGHGRVAALEILINNTAVANLIRENKTHQIQSSMQIGKSEGMLLMNDSLLEFVKKKQVTPEEAYIKAIDKNDIIAKFDSNGIAFSMSNLKKKASINSSEEAMDINKPRDRNPKFEDDGGLTNRRRRTFE